MYSRQDVTMALLVNLLTKIILLYQKDYPCTLEYYVFINVSFRFITISISIEVRSVCARSLIKYVGRFNSHC